MRHIRPAIAVIAVFTLLTGLALPVGLSGLAGLVLPFASGGSMIERNGQVVGSALIGQAWTQDRFLQGRPSATVAPDPADASKTVAAPYNAANSGGSNLGPTSKALLDRVAADVARLGPGPVPADAVTTSASGLDPDISPAAADRQVARIAQARGMPAEQVRATIAAHTRGRLLGLIGEARVNVLAVNLGLEDAAR